MLYKIEVPSIKHEKDMTFLDMIQEAQQKIQKSQESSNNTSQMTSKYN